MKKQEQVQRLKETLYVTLGAFILAISVNLIFLPNQIVAGGASGLSIVLNELFGWNVALTLYAINIPLLILCFFTFRQRCWIKNDLWKLN